MFNLIKSIIGYAGTSNMDSTIIYICAALLVVITAIFIDLVFQIFKSFIPRN